MRKIKKVFACCFILAILLGSIPGRAVYAENTAYENIGVYDYIVRMYEDVLGRKPDAEGLDAWYNQLVSGGQSGAQVARDFFFSQEYLDRSVGNEVFLSDLYKALFDREPDETGYGAWMAQLNAGVPRLSVLKGFVDSPEFASLCVRYGIVKGTVEAAQNGEAVYQVDQFVRRLYKTTLNREADTAGLESWKSVLLDKTSTGADVAYGFIFSRECMDKQLDDGAFVDLMYCALFDREADSSGRDGWLNLLEHGLIRQYVFCGFINSPEFQQLCSAYNIVKGSAVLTDIRDLNESLTIMIADLYMVGLQRNASTDELVNAVDLLSSHQENGYNYIKGVLESAEYTGKNTSDEQFLFLMYTVVLNIGTECEAYRSDLALLEQGASRNEIYERLLVSDTFVQRCEGLKIVAKGRLIDPDKPMIALTFDDGPSIYTPRVLDCLEQYDQAATFFVVGTNAARYGDYIKRAYDLGCEIGNHSYSHPDLTTLSASSVAEQVNRTNQYIFDAIGTYATITRTPGGSYNSTVCSAVNSPIILWSLDTVDWKTRNTQLTVTTVLNNVRDGDIVLMHDIHKPTVAAAEILIPELVRRGYQLVTVSEMAQYRGVDLENGKVYYSFR